MNNKTIKAFLATSEQSPIENQRFICKRMTPLYGESFTELQLRLEEGGYNVPELVSTSPVRKVTRLAGEVYLVKTQNTDYVTKIANDAQPLDTEKATYLAYAAEEPVVGRRFICTRLERDRFDKPLEVLTSTVQTVDQVAHKLFKVETLNSYYFVCIITD